MVGRQAQSCAVDQRGPGARVKHLSTSSTGRNILTPRSILASCQVFFFSSSTLGCSTTSISASLSPSRRLSSPASPSLGLHEPDQKPPSRPASEYHSLLGVPSRLYVSEAGRAREPFLSEEGPYQTHQHIILKVCPWRNVWMYLFPDHRPLFKSIGQSQDLRVGEPCSQEAKAESASPVSTWPSPHSRVTYGILGAAETNPSASGTIGWPGGMAPMAQTQ